MPDVLIPTVLWKRFSPSLKRLSDCPSPLQASLQQSLIYDLAVTVSPFLHALKAMRLALQPWQSEQQDFIAYLENGGWDEIWQEHPALERVLVQMLDLRLSAFSEMLERYSADTDANNAVSVWQTWMPRLAELEDIQTGISDPHQSGRRCAVLSRGDQRIVYKPKPLQAERAWLAVCRWLSQHKAPYCPRAVQVLDRGDYGWCEYIAADAELNKETAPELYFNLGAVLTVLYMLGATDCHRENFIVQAGHPVLVDCETLLQPQCAFPQLPDWVRDSVLGTEVLPFNYHSNAGQRLHFAGFDAKGLKRHSAAFREGFQMMYQFLLQHQTKFLQDLQDNTHELSLLKHSTYRFVYRSTETYVLTLGNAMKHLAYRGHREHAFAKLREYESARVDDAVKAAFYAEEQRALQQQDVPIFRVAGDSTKMILNGKRFSVFTCSPWQHLLQRVQCLSAEDCHEQLSIIGNRIN